MTKSVFMVVVVLAAGVARVGGADGAGAPEGAPAPQQAPVEIVFVTDRERSEGGSAEDRFGDGRGAWRQGYCRVRFSPIPGLSQLSELTPFYLPSETRDVEEVVEIDEQALWETVAAADAAGQRLVLMTHGYNMSFGKACRRAATLQRVLGDDGRILLFSWPSDAAILNYARDEADNAWSVLHMQRLIDALVQRLGRGNLQVFAHSLGARGIVEALLRMECDAAPSPLIDQLVLVAPDIDAGTFREQFPRLSPLASAITVYASDGDKPLRLSREVHGYPRLGEAGEHITVLDAMETIDVSLAPASEVSGHLYHQYSPVAMEDMRTLLLTGSPARERPGLVAREHDDGRYWQLAAP